MTVEPEVK